MHKAIHFLLLFSCMFAACLLHAQQQGLDPGFGNAGIILRIGPDPESGRGDIRSIAILPDGRFLVTGDSLLRYNADGTRDYSFSGAANYYIGNILLQPDGKILTAGGTHLGGYLGGAFRTLPEGGADSSFGVNGKITADDSTDIAGILLQPDGKVILIGGNDQKNYLSVFRYLPDGTADSSFGGNGRVFRYYQSPILRMYPAGGGLMADGRIVIGGHIGPAFGPDSFFAMRFLPDGVLDTSLNHRGVAMIPYIRPCTDVAVQPDGKILLAGYQNQITPDGPPFLLTRLNENGSIDSDFADGGIAAYYWGGGQENKARVMKLQPDGNIILAGRAWDDALQKYNFALVRFRPDGSLDSSFGHNGALQTRIRNNDDDIYDIALQPDGKIIAAGVTERENCSHCNDGAMVRYLGNGQTDTNDLLPSASEITLYPNPAGNKLYISYAGVQDIRSVSLYDATGRLLQQWEDKVPEINLKNRATGVYMLRFDGKEGYGVSKAFVVK